MSTLTINSEVEKGLRPTMGIVNPWRLVLLTARAKSGKQFRPIKPVDRLRHPQPSPTP